MHTDGTQPGGWWAVNLKEKYTIEKVKITNRGDGLGMKKACVISYLKGLAICDRFFCRKLQYVEDLRWCI